MKFNYFSVVRAAHAFSTATTNIPMIKNDLKMNIPVGPLNTVVNPEEKRKIIGDQFIKVLIICNMKLLDSYKLKIFLSTNDFFQFH